MPFILFKTYYKYGEWSSFTVADEEELRGEAESWLSDKEYELPEDSALDNLIEYLLNCGQETISNERGWGYVQIYEVPSVTNEWGPGQGSR